MHNIQCTYPHFPQSCQHFSKYLPQSHLLSHNNVNLRTKWASPLRLPCPSFFEGLVLFAAPVVVCVAYLSRPQPCASSHGVLLCNRKFREISYYMKKQPIWAAFSRSLVMKMLIYIKEFLSKDTLKYDLYSIPQCY